jgi:hypothetical protein
VTCVLTPQCGTPRRRRTKREPHSLGRSCLQRMETKCEHPAATEREQEADACRPQACGMPSRRTLRRHRRILRRAHTFARGLADDSHDLATEPRPKPCHQRQFGVPKYVPRCANMR